MYKLIAFIKKSFLVQWSYRLAIALGFLGTIVSLLMFYFIDKLFGSSVVPDLAPYGVSYLSYVLVGLAFSGFIGTSLGKLAGQISQEQTVGTLEALLVTPTRIETLVAAMIAWDLAYAFLEFALYILAGIFVFKIDFSQTNITAVLAITLLSIISFKALSMISAGFILVFKRGDPVSWLISIVVELLGGVYFPVSVLPDWLEKIAHLFPVTYAIKSVELAIYRGATITDLAHDLFCLAIFCVLLLPAGVFTLRYALQRAKKDGSLMQY